MSAMWKVEGSAAVTGFGRSETAARHRAANAYSRADTGKPPYGGHSPIKPITLIAGQREDSRRTRAFELHRTKQSPA
jgi:hypothetical protein